MGEMPTVVVERYTESKDNFLGLFELLCELHATVGLCPLDPVKMAQQAFAVARLGMTFVARDQVTGVIVGSIGLVENGFWYGAESFLNDKWFYVKPEYRGRLGVRLLHAARDEGHERSKIVFVFNTNPDKRQKHEVGDVVQRLGFVPHGYMMRLT